MAGAETPSSLGLQLTSYKAFSLPDRFSRLSKKGITPQGAAPGMGLSILLGIFRVLLKCAGHSFWKVPSGIRPELLLESTPLLGPHFP